MSDHFHKDFHTAFTMVKAGVAPFLVGPAGCGKTTIAKQIAGQLGLPFHYTGAVESAFQLRGFLDAQGRVARTPFREAYEHGGVFLFDEMDASNSNAVVSLHAALDNGVLDAPDGMIKRHKDFHFIAAANTWGHGATLEYIGRNALDGATLDRYAFVPMDYDVEMEQAVVAEHHPNQTSWPLIVHQARLAVRELKIHRIVSPRASFNGAALLYSGMELTTVFQSCVLKGLSPDDEAKILAKIDFNAIALQDSEELQRALAKQAEETSKLKDLLEKVTKNLNDTIECSTMFSTESQEIIMQTAHLLGSGAEVLKDLREKVGILNGLQASVAPILQAAQRHQDNLEALLQSGP